MERTVYYEARHKAIAEGGIEGIAAVLRGDDEAEKASLLFCLDYYLDPYYGCTLAHESEIFALLQQLLLSERSQAIRDDILQLLGDYCGDFSVLRSKICEASGELAGYQALDRKINLTTGTLLLTVIASRRVVAKFASPPHTPLFVAKMRQRKI